MKLIKIRLHPFAGTTDVEYTFNKEGITQIKGPNEFGKSTLARAIHAVIYTPVKLTKPELKKFGLNIPVGGDHATISLEFLANGNVYKLDKTWGEKPNVRLEGPGVSLSESTAVQNKLLEFFHFQEGTFRNVLYITQAELDKTRNNIGGAGNNMDSLQTLLGRNVINYGGVSWVTMKKELNEEIDNYFDHWDSDRKRPENNKEIDQPWKQKVGHILKAYYNFRTQETQYQEIRSYEEQADKCRAEITAIKESMLSAENFVKEHKGRRSDLQIRIESEAKFQKIDGEIQQLNAVLLRWPALQTQLSAAEDLINNLGTEIRALNEEKSNAQKSANGKALKELYDKLSNLKAELDRETKKLNELPVVDGDTLEEIEELQENIRDAEIKLEAQILSLYLRSTEDCAILLKDPINGERKINLGNGTEQTIDSIPGLFELNLGKLFLQVSSEAGSAEEIAEQKKEAENKIRAILARLNAGSLDELNARSIAWSAQSQTVAQINRTFKELCANKPYETIEKEVRDIETLPKTRSVEELQELLISKQAKYEKTQDERKALNTEQTKFIEAYESQQKLLQILGAKIGEKGKIETTLAKLAKLPEGFTDSQAFFQAYEQANDLVLQKTQELSGKEKHLSALDANQPEQTAEEIHDLAMHNKNIWERKMAEGEALLCLRKAIEKEEEAAGGDPYAEYQKRLEELFKQLTNNKYKRIQFDELLPVDVLNDHIALPADWLSQGTRDSLSLAIRLAMAEYYLKDKEGFLVMDDPMTNMDSERKQYAKKYIESFAAKHQVILFTCQEN